MKKLTFKSIAHPFFSTIGLEGFFEYYFPDITNEQLYECIEKVQREYIKSVNKKMKEFIKEKRFPPQLVSTDIYNLYQAFDKEKFKFIPIKNDKKTSL